MKRDVGAYYDLGCDRDDEEGGYLLEQLPTCDECGERIRDKVCYRFRDFDMLLCPDCLEWRHKVKTEDYIVI